MINANKLKGRLVEKGYTQAEAAAFLSISQPAFNQKINNIRPMDLNEAEKLSEFLDITHEEFPSFFLYRPVA